MPKQLRIQQGLIALSFSLLAMLVVARPLPGADDSGLLSKQDLKRLIASAKTPADHERLAKHFTAKADQLAAESKEHEELAAEYKAKPNIYAPKQPMSPGTAAHCEYFAQMLRKAAADARKLAADHELMAKGASN